MALKERFKSFFSGGNSEGSWRGPFQGQGERGNFFGLSSLEDGWQRNLRPGAVPLDSIPTIAAAKHLYRSAFSQLRGKHVRLDADGNINEVVSSAASRLLVAPNIYQTMPEFNSLMVDHIVTHGEVVAYCKRNDRFEPESLHILPRACWQVMTTEESEIFYFVSSNADQVLTPMNAEMAIPARDIIHIKWAANPNNPLHGVSPLAAAASAAGINLSLTASQQAFFSQMRRPSGYLSSDHKMSSENITALRAAWDEQSRGLATGGMPILANGLKFEPLGMTAVDAEIINSMKATNEDLARAMAVPPPLIGMLDHSTLGNVESLINAWLSLSLGGLIEKFERSLDRLFKFDSRTNRVEWDVSALLRSDLTARIESYSKMVTGGIASPNEIRRRENLTALPGGDNLFLQRQMVPVDLLTALSANELSNAQAPAPTPEPVPSIDEEEATRLAFVEISKAMER